METSTLSVQQFKAAYTFPPCVGSVWDLCGIGTREKEVSSKIHISQASQQVVPNYYEMAEFFISIN